MNRQTNQPSSSLRRRTIAVLLTLAAAFLLSACVAIGPPPVLPPAESRPVPPSEGASSQASSAPAVSDGREAAPLSFLEKGRSAYGRSTLSSEQQTAYDQLAEGILQHQEEIALSLGSEELLTQTLLCVRRDYPIISWLDNSYSYQMNGDQVIQKISLTYSKTTDQIASELTEISRAGQELTANLDEGLSDFDKALILYDRLCETVEYDLDAPNQRELYGALVDKHATCDGYSKAYQYLLSLVGIEVLIVYGEAEEPHAWNILRLDGSYYQTDSTWGDAALSDGRIFLSHEFAFLDDESFSRSHTSYGKEHNYPLPACGSMALNYFVQKGTQLEAIKEEELEKCLQSALELSLANGYDSVQIRFATPELFTTCQSSWFDSGKADQIMRDLAASRGKKAIGRSFSNYGDVVTYLIE